MALSECLCIASDALGNSCANVYSLEWVKTSTRTQRLPEPGIEIIATYCNIHSPSNRDLFQEGDCRRIGYSGGDSQQGSLWRELTRSWVVRNFCFNSRSFPSSVASSYPPHLFQTRIEMVASKLQVTSSKITITRKFYLVQGTKKASSEPTVKNFPWINSHMRKRLGNNADTSAEIIRSRGR